MGATSGLLVAVLRTDWFDFCWRRGLLLFFLDVGKDGAQMFVLGDSSVRDALLVRIEDAVGQGDAFGTDLNAPVRYLVGIDVFADQAACQIVDFQPDALAVVLQRQILCNIAFIA